jgi:Fe(II)/alpha-ketoglutarate-dependent arginine beta-hydroxylase
MHRIVLTEQEVQEIQSLVARIARHHHTVENPEFLDTAVIYAHELPRRLRIALNEFRLFEPAGVCIVSGYPVDQDKIGKTPEHWKNKPEASPALEEEIFFMLCGALLGDLFGWSTQQGGNVLHELMPIKGHEQEQLGSGSEQKLWWHTEDAFHPYKPDYVGLMCLRNPDSVPTTIMDASKLKLDPADRQILSEPRFYIRPDESHLPKNRHTVNPQLDNLGRLIEAAYERIHQMNTNPQKVPILFGDFQSPYMCLDPYFMDLDQLDPEARRALEALIQAIDEHIEEVALKAGDVCFIDNYRAVHGRNPFKARYDGNDRWLKRINITRDIRKSRNARLSSSARVIF